ncbi:MAG: 2Fe-2S iron-sulfur cluster-binding protein [Chloroflexota bacterium]
MKPSNHCEESTAPDSVEVLYADEKISAKPGKRLLDVILEAGIEHRHICGGNGFCTSCRVEVLKGERNLSPVSALERDRLGARAGHLRLACQTCVFGPVSVCVPLPISTRFSPDGV